MKNTTIGYSSEDIAAVSKRVGYDISEFAPKPSPEEVGLKTLLIALTGVILAIPVAVVRIYPDDLTSFLLFSFLCLAFVDFVGWTITRIRLHDYEQKWEAAAAGITNANGKTACKAVQETIYYFRVLLKWRRHMKYTAVWTELAYLSSLAYAVIASLASQGIFEEARGINAFGPFAPYALGYYAIAYLSRNFLLNKLVSITDALDPTIQICCALADVHKKYDDCALK